MSKKAAKKQTSNLSKWEDENEFQSSGEVGFDIEGLEESTIVSGATFWDFKTKPSFIGRLKRVMLAEADDEKMNRKKGDEFAYLMEDAKGDEHLIGASFSIEKAIKSESVGIGSILHIKFVEQKKAKSGRKFNVYDVKLLKEKAK